MLSCQITEDMKSHCVAQSGLEFLALRNPPTLASQSAGITTTLAKMLHLESAGTKFRLPPRLECSDLCSSSFLDLPGPGPAYLGMTPQRMAHDYLCLSWGSTQTLHAGATALKTEPSIKIQIDTK
ncbi:hypothetical protein AAY473_007201, partial [Plecturocebus cupreus]